MKKYILIFVLLALSTITSYAQCPIPTLVDAGKVCIANADGTSSWSSSIIDTGNQIQVSKNIMSTATSGIAFQCGVNNTGCLSQVDKSNIVRNIFYMDNAQNSVLGSTHDKGDYSILSYNGINFFLNDTTYNFEGLAWPNDKLSISSIGSGYSYSAGGDNNMLLTVPAGSGSGFLVMATNRHTNVSYPSQTTFLNAVSNDTYIDLQFGLRDTSGNNQIRFRLGSGAAGSATLDCTVTNGGSTHTISTSYFRGVDRRVFKLFIPANNSGENIALRPANSNNEYIDASPACEFAFNDSALPSGLANLIPFVQFRNYDMSNSRIFNFGKLEFQSGF